MSSNADEARAGGPKASGAPAITFAIPYFANAAYLLEAMASVRAQTRSDWQLIVVDDAGPEPVGELVAAIDDLRISAIRNSANLGLARNWNECIRLADAPWVTLLHADDRLAPGYSAAVLSAAERDPELAAVFTDTHIIGADGSPMRSLPDAVKRLARRPKTDHDVSGDEGFAGILANNYVFCPAMCHRRDLALLHPFDDRWRMVMDLDHTGRLLLDGHRLRGIRQPLYQYRRHGSNQTASLTASAVRFQEEIALYREFALIAEAKGWAKTMRAARHRTMIRIHLGLQATIDLGSLRFDAARHKAVLLMADIKPARSHRSQHAGGDPR